MWRRGSIGSPTCGRRGDVLIRRLVYVAFFIEVGLLLLVLPWSAFWEHNYFAEAWPPLQPLLTNNFTRGAVTGLGLVNLGAGFVDLARVFSSRARGDVPVPDGTPRS
jgi:hypothetical protein